MRYFAMIDGHQCGPYTLDELPGAGVRPDTYVWCKGMDDWEKAEDVADICRFFRGHIFDMMHGGKKITNPSPDADAPVAADALADPYEAVPPRFREFARKSGIDPEQFAELNPEPDLSRPPMSTFFLALLMTIFCFPITGLVAIYYSFKAGKTWNEAERDDHAGHLYSDRERRDLKLKAYDYSRRAKMWIGISFFLGMIVSALVGSHII